MINNDIHLIWPLYPEVYWNNIPGNGRAAEQQLTSQVWSDADDK